MTIAEGQAEDGGEALAREAAHWFARMRGPDADASRVIFEAWLAQGPERRVAYNRTAEIFAMGKLLAEPGIPASARPRRHKTLAVAVAAATACVIGIGGWVASHPSGSGADPRQIVATTDHRTLSMSAGEARVVRLADGSTVRLGYQTILDIDIGGGQRSFRLLRGQARFEVAHERRPFIVFAGGGSVTARGTIFEVALGRSGMVDVRLLQGAVDVALPRQTAAAQSAVRKLATGESVSFVVQPDSPASPLPPATWAAAPTAAARDFQATPVSELIALANRGSARPIRLTDASLGARRVSGLFRVDDTEVLARRLGALFGREVDASDPREIVLAASDQSPAPGAQIGRRPTPGNGE